MGKPNYDILDFIGEVEVLHQDVTLYLKRSIAAATEIHSYEKRREALGRSRAYRNMLHRLERVLRHKPSTTV